MKKLSRTLAITALLLAWISSVGWALPPTGNSVSGSVAEYNAAQVRDNNGMVTVPGSMTTYNASVAIPVGTVFTITLPAGMEFSSQNPPSLSSTDETFQLVSIGKTAQFTTLTSDNAATSTITLNGYSVKDASVLEKVIPVADALPISMQAVGIDPAPLSFPEFASDSGIQAVFVGAIQFIDLRAPSNGSEFGTGIDSPTAVFSAIAISPETHDHTNGTTPLLGPDGQPQKLASYDTVTVEMPGILFHDLSVFTSFRSDCISILSKGKVAANALIFPNVPLNQEIFFCVTNKGKGTMKMFGFPSSLNSPGWTTVLLHTSHPYDDFLTSTNVDNEFPGFNCYAYLPAGYGGGCLNEFFDLSPQKP